MTILDELRRKRFLSRLYDESKLPFRDAERCELCGAEKRIIPETVVVLASGLFLVPERIEYVQVVKIDDCDIPICRQCFCSMFYIRDAEVKPRHGNTHNSTPSSQRNYDGGRFHGGEW